MNDALTELRAVLHAEACVRGWDRLVSALMSASPDSEARLGRPGASSRLEGQGAEVGLGEQGAQEVALDYACHHLQARAEDWRPVALWLPATWVGAQGVGWREPGARLLAALGLDALPMVALAPGRFVMGSSEGYRARFPSELQHEVELTRGFLMGRLPVTQAHWVEIMGHNPSKSLGNLRPVEQVSWFDAVRFCNAWSLRLGLTPVYDVGDGTRPEVSVDREADGIRLPTEAQWEYACRAGTTGERYGELDDIGWFLGNSGRQSREVGLKLPNRWGLLDTLGNVSEWVEDRFHRDLHLSAPLRDPVHTDSGDKRVHRGGSWGAIGAYVRAPRRNAYDPLIVSQELGLRCARLIPALAHDAPRASG